VGFGGSEPTLVSSGGVVRRRTAHDIELDVRRVGKELQRILAAGDGAESYCTELADEDPELYAWLFVEHCPEEAREAMLNVLQDHPELLVTYH
jgi:hypothetical protein